MNATEQFHDLAIRVLSGQGTESDRSALESLLGENPAWRADYAEMRAVWDWMGELARLPRKPSAAPSGPPPPPMRRLRREVRDVFARKKRGMPSSTPSDADDDFPMFETLPPQAWPAANLARKVPPDPAAAPPEPVSLAALRHRTSFDNESDPAIALRRQDSLERLHRRLREAHARLRECEEVTRACRMELDAILGELESLAPRQP